MKSLAALALLALIGLAWFFATRQRSEAASDFQKLSGPERIARARAAHGEAIRERFVRAGVRYPGGEIFIRAFKRERELELWARDSAQDAFRLVAMWPVLAASGGPGPKLRQGDRQVPEGFYVIDRFNAESIYHLSLGIDYPNADDLTRADPRAPGGDIFIHGAAVSIGCLAIGDPAIEELFLAALDARDAGQGSIPVHIFPARMSGAKWESFAKEHIAKKPELQPFWRHLQPAYEAFERHRRAVRINDGDL